MKPTRNPPGNNVERLILLVGTRSQEAGNASSMDLCDCGFVHVAKDRRFSVKYEYN